MTQRLFDISIVSESQDSLRGIIALKTERLHLIGEFEQLLSAICVPTESSPEISSGQDIRQRFTEAQKLAIILPTLHSVLRRTMSNIIGTAEEFEHSDMCKALHRTEVDLIKLKDILLESPASTPSGNVLTPKTESSKDRSDML